MGYYDAEYEAEVTKERRIRDAEHFETMLCVIFPILTDAQFSQLPYSARSWWKDKKAALDRAEQLKREAEARQRAQETGLAKLTPEEREALNVKIPQKGSWEK